MGEIMSYQNYEQYKRELDGELQKTAEGFVRIGYLLKVARDTNILAESGYKSVAEFAQAEYNLDKTQVSRFISINDKFSEGGYADHLLPEYKGFGYAKLTIMLQIPTEIAEELSPNLSKADIQAIKEEIDEEKKISDIEVALESKKPNLEDMNLLEKVLYLLMGENGEWRLYEKIWQQYQKTMDEYSVRSILAPFGEKVYSVRIPGTGRVMMILDDTKDDFSITNTRTDEKQVYTWMDMADAVHRMVDIDEADTAEKSWEKLYMAEWPGKAEVAPVQQKAPEKKAEKKPELKKESKVSKAKVEKKPQKHESEPEKEEEEQLEGQMSVEDYPEFMPDGEENDGEGAGMDDGNAQPGEPDCGGDENADGEPEDAKGPAGDEIPGNDESDGAPAGRGCEENPPELIESYDEIVAKMDSDMDYLNETLWAAVEEFAENANAEELKETYLRAVSLAAGLEKLMLWREKHEG